MLAVGDTSAEAIDGAARAAVAEGDPISRPARPLAARPVLI